MEYGMRRLVCRKGIAPLLKKKTYGTFTQRLHYSYTTVQILQYNSYRALYRRYAGSTGYNVANAA